MSSCCPQWTPEIFTKIWFNPGNMSLRTPYFVIIYFEKPVKTSTPEMKLLHEVAEVDIISFLKRKSIIFIYCLLLS